MTPDPVSLIIVSQKRPKHLLRLLQSLRHQTHSNFEVIVVADTLPIEFESRVKFFPFLEANISAARNIGIKSSTTSVIAFCDDDAIPDPPWLERLTSPFANKSIGAATGFTRGRNGISRQWGAMRFDMAGCDHHFEIDESLAAVTCNAESDMPVKLIGTNMAIRKSALLDINGFDENFRFFLDETDVKLRLDRDGWQTAIVGYAQVHHSFASSETRKANRAPTDLFEIGASKAYFCKSHLQGEVDPALRDFTNEQIIRLTTFVENHNLKRRDVTPLMDSLADGMSEGLQRQRKQQDLSINPAEFLRFDVFEQEHVVICAGPREGNWMKETVADQVKAGKCVSVVQLLPSTRYFQVSFRDGYWLHRGGVWGKSNRTQPPIQFFTFKQRFAAEINRLSTMHSVDRVLTNSLSN